jgi:hypothetical protein
MEEYWVSVAAWLRLLTLNHLPLIAVGSNPNRDFGFKLVMECGWFYSEIMQGWHLSFSSTNKARQSPYVYCVGKT